MALDWNQPYNAGTWSWHLGFQGIALSEYHLRTGDRSVLKTLESTMKLLVDAQWKGDIRHWKSEQIKGIDQALLDRHQALYAGGFGHAPYTEILSRGGGGYGPMQWPTCLALMTWQLGKQCGIEADEEAVERSFQFLDYGTTAAGSIAYGGEFTLNNGPVDSENWKANTRNGGSHKSGLGHLVFLLSPERKESAKMIKLHLSNIDAAYKDMPNGHACAMMGLTWGWAGTYARTRALQCCFPVTTCSQCLWSYYAAYCAYYACDYTPIIILILKRGPPRLSGQCRRTPRSTCDIAADVEPNGQ
jgi:hypothetical protein